MAGENEGGAGNVGGAGTGNTGGGAGGIPPAGGPAGGTPPAWYASADAETIGYLQNRGWDKVDAVTAAVNASKAHREAEKLIGVPADQVIRLPKDANSPDWNGVWQRLGAPADGKYDFSAVKFADGTPIDQPFADAITAAAVAAHLPKDAAVQIAQAVVKYTEAQETSETALNTAKAGEAKANLQKEWGPNFDANRFVAGQGAKAVGVDPETVAALEGQIGYDKVMKLFHTIGVKMGEGRFVESQAPGGNGNAMSREQAVDTKRGYLNDAAWVKRYSEGGRTEFQQMLAVNRMISGDFETKV